jgi:hypothetical protein
MPWLEKGSSPAATRPPRWPRAHLASTDEKPGLAPSRALLAFDAGYLCRYAANGSGSARICQDLHGAAPARRGGGCGGTRSRQRTGHTQHKATDLPAHLTLPYNQGRKVDGHFVDIYPQSRRGPALKSCRRQRLGETSLAGGLGREPAERPRLFVRRLPGLCQEARLRG